MLKSSICIKIFVSWSNYTLKKLFIIYLLFIFPLNLHDANTRLYLVTYCLHFRQQTAYICNMKEHWFTIRKIGFQWFNLNSLLSGPELISDTYLSLFIIQLLQEGNIYVCIYI